MDKVTEYHRRMVNVLSLARGAPTEQERSQLFAIAESWSKLAAEHDRHVKTRTKSH